MADEPTILDEAFIITPDGIVRAQPCEICGRPISIRDKIPPEFSLTRAVTCGPCWDYYGTSIGSVLGHCMKTGTLRPRR
jgi:hypothetical protein